jgi:hypothetical protein
VSIDTAVQPCEDRKVGGMVTRVQSVHPSVGAPFRVSCGCSSSRVGSCHCSSVLCHHGCGCRSFVGGWSGCIAGHRLRRVRQELSGLNHSVFFVACPHLGFVPVAMFCKYLKTEKDRFRPVATGLLSRHVLDLTHAQFYLIFGP